MPSMTGLSMGQSTTSRDVTTAFTPGSRAACRPNDDKRGTIAYRTKVAGVLLKRTAAIAAERAKQNRGN